MADPAKLPIHPDDDEAWDRLGDGYPDASGSVFDIVNTKGRIQGVRIDGIEYPAPQRITEARWLAYWQAKVATALEDCDRKTSLDSGVLIGIVTGVAVSVMAMAAAVTAGGVAPKVATWTYAVLGILLLLATVYKSTSLRDTSKTRDQLERVRLAYASHQPAGRK